MIGENRQIYNTREVASLQDYVLAWRRLVEFLFIS
jgi:hypothetical protein